MIKQAYTEYLLFEAQHNNEQALKELLLMMQARLLIFARQMLNNSSLAEDAVQESLLAIIKGIRSLKKHKAFHAWAYRITANKCKDQLRKSNYMFQSDEKEISEIEAESSANDERLDMIRLIRRLPKIEQTVIQLFYYEGFKVAEIAQILNKPAGTIKSLLFQAREKIKQIFGDDNEIN